MSQSEPVIGRPGSAQQSGLANVPPVWVAVVVLLSAYGIISTWPATYAYDLPASAVTLVYAGLIADVVNILWAYT
jgi:hypothetical protein